MKTEEEDEEEEDEEEQYFFFQLDAITFPKQRFWGIFSFQKWLFSLLTTFFLENLC